MPGIQTDEKKQHFDDIYVEATPVAFKQRIIDELEYISDDNNRATFDRLILPWVTAKTAGGQPLQYVDLCCCFGNTTLAVAHGMSVAEIRENWSDERACAKAARPRRFPAHATGIDISGNALAYGASAGIFDQTIEADLNRPSPPTRDRLAAALGGADVLVSTAALVYLEPEAIDWLIRSFAQGDGEGYVLVNFLNPFALDKADATKRALLQHLTFVGSTATRHRRLSPLEQANYAGEEWSLLEIWVLSR